MREELRVDVELADAAGDQLGKLAAEVQDGDDAGLRYDGRGGRVIVRADGGRRVEGNLEIGLNLSIV